MIEKTFNLMGGEVYVYIETNKKNNEVEILQFAQKTLIDLISIFNLYDKTSLISKLNINKEVKFNSELGYLLNTSIKLNKITKGYFNIFLGSEILARKQNKTIQNKKLENKRKKIDSEKLITINKEKIKLNELDINIDMGGIAKGYIVDRTIEIIVDKYNKNIKSILIDARGDIKGFGEKEFKIEVENPFNPNISFEKINLQNASIVTSGHNKQKFENGSHIIGKPTDIYTITLVSKKIACHILDALTKYFILLKSEKTLELIEFEPEFKEIEALIILNNGKVLKSSFWDQYQ